MIYIGEISVFKHDKSKFFSDQNPRHARFLSRTIFVVYDSCTISHDSQFCRARNRAWSHDKIFVVISNPALDPI